jgi:hypothetical protein
MAMTIRIILYNLFITWSTNYVHLLDKEFEMLLKAQSTKESLCHFSFLCSPIENTVDAPNLGVGIATYHMINFI